jgi:hypothetical protein
MTRASIFLAKSFYATDGLHRNSGLPELRNIIAASRVNPTCGVKPGNDDIKSRDRPSRTMTATC